MLSVISPEEVFEIIKKEFNPIEKIEQVKLDEAIGRILSEDIVSKEYIPSFNRSAMDGYAIKASDSYGCSEAIPAILKLKGKIQMGECPETSIEPGSCYYVPTGGALPEGADSVVMIEYTEDYGDGTIGILKPSAPGSNYVFKGDDAIPGDAVIHKGDKLTAAEIGSLAAMGISKVNVVQKPVVGVISTGDELIDIESDPLPGQIRNVNSSVLSAIVNSCGAKCIDYGIVKDDEKLITETLLKAIDECDLVLMSGGSSAGDKDNAAKIISELGELLFHGIALKPGKPTMLGRISGKPVFGIAGHPGGAYFITNVFVKKMIMQLTNQSESERPRKAVLTEAVNSNHGRAQYLAVMLRSENGELYADPIISKSGLITSLTKADAYIYIPRDCEGLAKGSIAEVYDVI